MAITEYSQTGFVKQNILTSSYAISILVSIPWITMSAGGFLYTDYYIDSLLIFICSIAMIFFFANRVERIKSKVFLSCYKTKETLLTKLMYIVMFITLCFLIKKLYDVVKNFSFDLNSTRIFYFRDESVITDFFGTIRIKLIYSNILLPFFIFSIVAVNRWRKKDFILIVLFLISTMLNGGRFGLYNIALIYIVNAFFSHNNIRNVSFMIFSLFLLAMFVTLNRMYYMHGSFSDIIAVSIRSIWLYHSVQLGVLTSVDLYKSYIGPFIGITTPIFILMSRTSPEATIGSVLDEAIFTSKYFSSEGGFNAFGTSIAFFYGAFRSYGIVFFFVSVIVIYLFADFIMPDVEKKKILFKFILISYFFSAFQPVMFSFSWWFTMLMIFLFHFFFKREKVYQPHL